MAGTPDPALWVLTEDHEAIPTFVDPDGWWEAGVRFDGCVHLRHYSNRPRTDPERRLEDEDYIHICDLDDAIARLVALREAAQSHFGQWPQ
jgi:hypothetical protein